MSPAPSHAVNVSDATLKTWRALYGAIADPVFVCRPTEVGEPGQIVFENVAAQQLLRNDKGSEQADPSDPAIDEPTSVVGKLSSSLFLTDDNNPLQITCTDFSLDASFRAAADQLHRFELACNVLRYEDESYLVVVARPDRARDATTSSDIVPETQSPSAAAMFEQILDAVQTPVTILDEHCQIRFMNPAGARNLDTTPEQVKGVQFGAVLPDFAELTQKRVTAVLCEMRPQTFEDAVELADGERWFRTAMRPLSGSSDDEQLVQVVSHELTAQLGTQQALRESSERLQSLAANVPGAIYQFTHGENSPIDLKYLSQPALDLLNLSLDEVQSDPTLIYQRLHPDDVSEFRTALRKSVTNRSDFLWEGRLVSDGQIRWLQAASQIRQAAGGGDMWDGIAMDVTEKHHLDEIVRRQKQQFRTLVENCRDGIMVHDGFQIRFANSAMQSLVGAGEAKELVGRAVVDIIAEESREMVLQRIATVMRGDNVPYMEFLVRRLDGTLVLAEGVGSAVSYRGKRCVQVIIRDITERDAWTRTIQESEARFWALFDLAPMGIALLDSDGSARMSNAAFRAHLGYTSEQLHRLVLPDIVVGESNRPLEQWLRIVQDNPNGHTEEVQLIRSDGKAVWSNLTLAMLPGGEGEADSAICMVNDISERKAAEETARHLHKLEAIGQLTGGVAHDFNNLLAVISGNLELLSRGLDDVTSLELTRNASTAADRGAELTRQLLAFGRRAPLNPVTVNLNAAIQQWRPLLQRTIPSTVLIEAAYCTDPLPVHVDRTELENALLNLALNASDAMSDGGVLTIGTRRITVVDLPYSLELKQVDHASILISDTGVGMDTSVQDQAFDPFFTTKEVGEGSGLGLSMVYGFMKQSGGHVLIDSNPDRGTAIELLFPCTADRTIEPVDPTPSHPAIPHQGDGQIVLVVEDDVHVRDVILMQLDTLGYRPIPTDGVQSAVAILESEQPIDVLLTDIVMPGSLQGSQLAWQMRPNLGVVLMSGYTDHIQAVQIVPDTAQLAKPFSIHHLAAALQQVLQRQVG